MIAQTRQWLDYTWVGSRHSLLISILHHFLTDMPCSSDIQAIATNGRELHWETNAKTPHYS